MKILPLIKTWSGDGLGLAGAVTLTQIKRTDTVALYQRTQKNGAPGGYEVFIIKKRLKGQPLPGGLFELEDREVYPSANSFGKTGWAPGSLWHAMKIYNELVTGKIEPVEGEDTEDAPEVPTVKREKKTPKVLTIPVAEFSCKELAASNQVEYPEAFIFLKSAVDLGTVKFVREERRNVKGKPTKIFTKV